MQKLQQILHIATGFEEKAAAPKAEAGVATGLKSDANDVDEIFSLFRR